MKCPNCSTENRDGAKFCDECGFPLTGKIAAAALEESNLSNQSTAELRISLDDELLDDTGEQQALEQEAIEEEPAGYEEEIEEDYVEVAEFAEAEEPAEEIPFEEEVEEAPRPFDPSITVDLSGLRKSAFGDEYTERLIAEDYASTENAFRDGATMQMKRIDGEEPPKSKQFLASSTKKKDPRKRRMAIAAIAVVALIAIAAFATWSMELWGGKSVPNVVGMTQADAAGILTERNFMVRTTQVKSDETEGLVLIQDPSGGSRLEEGEEVVIHIATARIIPDVVGKPIEEAKAAIDTEGFVNVIYTTQRSDEAEGTVLSITPATGERAKSTAEISVVSAIPYRVPDISGMYLDEAIEAVHDAGLNPVVIYVNTESYPDGSLIGPDPAADTVVAGGSDVYIQIAVARAAQLEAATQSYLQPGNTVTIGMFSYEIMSLDSYSYIGDNRTSYSMTARPYTYFFGEIIYASPQSLSGEILWSDDNSVIEIY